MEGECTGFTLTLIPSRLGRGIIPSYGEDYTERFASGLVKTTRCLDCRVEHKLGIMHGRLAA